MLWRQSLKILFCFVPSSVRVVSLFPRRLLSSRSMQFTTCWAYFSLKVLLTLWTCSLANRLLETPAGLLIDLIQPYLFSISNPTLLFSLLSFFFPCSSSSYQWVILQREAVYRLGSYCQLLCLPFLVLKGPYQYWAFPYFPFYVLFEPFLWKFFLLGNFPVLLFQFFDFSVCSLQCWIILLCASTLFTEFIWIWKFKYQLRTTILSSTCSTSRRLESITSNWYLHSSLLWHFRRYFSLPFWRSWVCLSADNSVISIYFTRFCSLSLLELFWISFFLSIPPSVLLFRVCQCHPETRQIIQMLTGISDSMILIHIHWIHLNLNVRTGFDWTVKVIDKSKHSNHTNKFKTLKVPIYTNQVILCFV